MSAGSTAKELSDADLDAVPAAFYDLDAASAAPVAAPAAAAIDGPTLPHPNTALPAAAEAPAAAAAAADAAAAAAAAEAAAASGMAPARDG